MNMFIASFYEAFVIQKNRNKGNIELGFLYLIKEHTTPLRTLLQIAKI